MKVLYYPGCTLKTRARRMDLGARLSMSALGVELVEPERWTCCGVMPPLADDDIIRLLGPVRNLIRFRNLGASKVITACAMCHNSLAGANRVMQNGGEKKRTLDLYFEEEKQYNGEVEVVHLLRFINDEIGLEAVRKQVKKPLDGMRAAPYYGCTLLRPPELAIDDSARPTIMGELLESLGARSVDFTAYSRCCSSFQSVSHPEAASRVASKVIGAAGGAGASAIVTSCPLCHHNLENGRHGPESEKAPGGDTIGIFYFTELMARAFGLEIEP